MTTTHTASATVKKTANTADTLCALLLYSRSAVKKRYKKGRWRTAKVAAAVVGVSLLALGQQAQPQVPRGLQRQVCQITRSI